MLKVNISYDPEGVAMRKSKSLKRRLYYSKGPNFSWHLDGYDKLSPYGLAIHGCIDGFSRKMLWLHLTPTNHNPKVISRFYLETVENVCGIPKYLRSDYGTENYSVASIHIAFNMFGLRDKSYIYGPSNRNVRIEGWWSQLRRYKTSWWINLLKSLKECNYFNGSQWHKYTVAFCMAHIVEAELNEFKQEWNNHYIRANSKTLLPSGIPNDLFDMPHSYGVEDHLQEVNASIWVYAMEKESVAKPRFYPHAFEYQANAILATRFDMERCDITADNCETVYKFLIDNMEH
jgi:hypothetical protein